MESEIKNANSENSLKELKFKLNRAKLESLFTSKYEKYDAILTVYAGAGGRDAEDFAEMILRMYQRFADKRKWNWQIIHDHKGAEGGISTASIEIKGKYAYGFLKKENGVHRLVRISPFSSNKLRHTSFALIEIMPKFEDTDKNAIELKEEDLRIDTYRSSGPGGQNVNKRESAVRITHLPTGLAVACQSERLQIANKEKALLMLKSKIAKLLEEKKLKEISELKGEKVKIEWGSQIRSYVLHPYQLVKDHRTKTETSKIDEVLNGDLEIFIEAELKI